MPDKSRPVAIQWFRRDLRLEDNTSLNAALDSGLPVLGVFIFDADIIDTLPRDDARVTFLHDSLKKINGHLQPLNSALLIRYGRPAEVFKEIVDEYDVKSVFANEDYEPYAIKRDSEIQEFLQERNVNFHLFTDHVIYSPGTVLKNDGDPYTVYTPFRNKLLSHADEAGLPRGRKRDSDNFLNVQLELPSLEKIGFSRSNITVPDLHTEYIDDYDEERDDPVLQHTTHAGPHLRFGTVSLRHLVALGQQKNDTYLGELIWREFFINILYHFPKVVSNNFRSKYDSIPWRNDEEEFERWKAGKTGYPMVDAGMRQLNSTGYMHNRVRMVVASFLCKHLLIDWKWGEAYFAQKLLDYELASNNGNWQWAAGTGCDAAPYFRVFNPHSQQKKYDPDGTYARRWIDELDTFDYPDPVVEHAFARNRAIETYKKALA